jgi:ABC-type lipoprotein export system ATPase subunit
VRQGEVVGIIGLPREIDFHQPTHWTGRCTQFVCRASHAELPFHRGTNGAGKSTLLKILSRITEPTTGKIRIKGRVASLLEVGTGFHPELTGRENIFLNGAILGMHRAEIRKKFDEIVAFAEVEKFLDTPVERYSSDMYMRLARCRHLLCAGQGFSQNGKVGLLLGNLHASLCA